MRKSVRLLGLLLGLVAFVPPAAAHNAAHVELPNGECVNVGSGESAPEVPVQNPNRNVLGPGDDLGRLDLMPETTGDQYGARFAAERSSDDALSAGHRSVCRN